MQLHYVCFPFREREKRDTSNYVATGFHNSVCLASTLNAFCCWNFVEVIGEIQQIVPRHGRGTSDWELKISQY